jgi:hypothetical protein
VKKIEGVPTARTNITSQHSITAIIDMFVYIRGMRVDLELLADNTYSASVDLPSGLSLTVMTAPGQGIEAVKRFVVSLWGENENETHNHPPCECDVIAKRQRS